ncbi:MAG: Biopolymer transport protein ExbB [Syntrophorhabdus sp. PtaB.Bin006]|nr:MAG: Biopolymer transport protein ExbB [Syntrophorhabdus sp. PtaB.Bin006]
MGGFGNILFSAGPMAKAVVLILFFFSVVSWTIIFRKWRELRKVRENGETFLKLVKESRSLGVLAANHRQDHTNPFSKLLALSQYEVSLRSAGDRPMNVETIMAIKGIMQATAGEETARLEKRLSFLATTANTAPFIGLFGTVWGIMDSFREIGIKGTTSLAVVAPGISEALIATAIGLATAIPAVLAYNYFTSRLKAVTSMMENASTYILGLLTR